MTDKFGSLLHVADAESEQCEMKCFQLWHNGIAPEPKDPSGDYEGWLSYPTLGFISRGDGAVDRSGDQIYVHRVVIRALYTHKWNPAKIIEADRDYLPSYWQQDLVLDTRANQNFIAAALPPARYYSLQDFDIGGPVYPLALPNPTLCDQPDRYHVLLTDNFITDPEFTGGTTAIVTPSPGGIIPETVQTFNGPSAFSVVPTTALYMQVGGMVTRDYEFEFSKPMLVKYNFNDSTDNLPDRELFLNLMVYNPAFKVADFDESLIMQSSSSIQVFFSDVPLKPVDVRANPSAVVDENDYYEYHEADPYFPASPESPPRRRGRKREFDEDGDFDYGRASIRGMKRKFERSGGRKRGHPSSRKRFNF